MGCPRHRGYKGTKKPSYNDGVMFCKTCMGMFVAGVAMSSRLVHECIKFALLNGIDASSFAEEAKAYLDRIYELENENGSSDSVLHDVR